MKLASRSVCLRSITELWAHSNSIEQLHEQLKKLPDEVMPHFEPHLSFKIKVESFGHAQSLKEKIQKIETFSYLPIQGPIKLKNPDRSFLYTEYYGLTPNNVPEQPYHVFFGRVISSGQRNVISELSLKKRKFIGNTSMDAQLSLLMANMAKVSDGDLIFDPFVGSGSLLVAAARFGGHVLGADIDYLMLHGRTKPTRKQDRFKNRAVDESIYSNMKQYGILNNYLDVVVADSSLPLWRDDLIFDAIITDPPYGIREATERVGSTKSNVCLNENQVENHIPSKVTYNLAHILSDLLCFASKHLKLGGRLVTWVPIFRSDYKEEDLPQHPNLELVGNCEQVLSKYAARRLLTYEKKTQPQENIVPNDIANSYLDFREKYFNHVRKTRKKYEATKKFQAANG
ncbi:tRNA (guanine(10)-N2)-methyltransferase homolog [Nilaparvata lugens]|uniref:tRNA (guanine(10)-N2)-methyltransferase homolog n=1 Tax=Nilaparvata lugens TaxID=108931 RepID=UPI00193D64EF|nr:tRNA (guanine(10)-N2)-methyltransferase homolog [Nilaparvata lugens]